MCRLLGYAAAAPLSAHAAVGSAELAEFLDLAQLHCDGWGIATVPTAGADPVVVTSELGAHRDPQFPRENADRHGVGGLLHLRWATDGLAVRPENTHPFLDDGIAFAHNGSVDPAVVESLLDPIYLDTLRGTTDSERYFALVRQFRRDTDDLAEAVAGAIAALRPLAPTKSLNALALDDRQLVAVHASSDSTLSAEDMDLCLATDLPPEHHHAYFRMRMRRSSSGVQIGSTGFGRVGWEPLPLDCVVAVELGTLNAVIRPLTRPGALSAPPAG